MRQRGQLLDRGDARWQKLRAQELAEIEVAGEAFARELLVLRIERAERREHLGARVQHVGQDLLVALGVGRQLLLELRQRPERVEHHHDEDSAEHALLGDAAGRHQLLDLGPRVVRDLHVRLLAPRERVGRVGHCPIHDQCGAQGLLQDRLDGVVRLVSRSQELQLREHNGEPLEEAWLPQARPHHVRAQRGAGLREVLDLGRVRHQLPRADVDRALAESL
mmetsp:Transcript_28286/g.85258  ORF Transcript_28286/g.85258 Transcript_28286/m.85258 type:complete len:221 (-) Transcript_28286:2963-3625(-)